MEVWAIQGGIRMYKYVDRQQVQRYDRKCRTILEKLRQVLREDYGIISQISLVGSGARGMVTRNGNGPFDLDYNLILQSYPEKFNHDLAGLKRVIRETLDSISMGVNVSFGQDSRSAVTILEFTAPAKPPEFHADLAILSKNINGDFQRLIHNKQIPLEGYTWNQLPDSNRVGKRAAVLRQQGYWADVRKAYLDRKNWYLRRPLSPRSSFEIYVETVNEMFQRFHLS